MSRICFAFEKGTCDRGSECRFSHSAGGGGGSGRGGGGGGGRACYDFQRGNCTRPSYAFYFFFVVTFDLGASSVTTLPRTQAFLSALLLVVVAVVGLSASSFKKESAPEELVLSIFLFFRKIFVCFVGCRFSHEESASSANAGGSGFYGSSPPQANQFV